MEFFSLDENINLQKNQYLKNLKIRVPQILF